MSEDLKFPNVIVVNRNLIAMLIDALVEEGALSPEVRDRIIDDTLGSPPMISSQVSSRGERRWA